MRVNVVNLVLGMVTSVLGFFVMASPERSARVWGRKQLGTLTFTGRTWYLRGFRMLGMLLCLAGVLVALESIAFHG